MKINISSARFQNFDLNKELLDEKGKPKGVDET